MTFFIKQRLNMDNSTYVPKESETFPYENNFLYAFLKNITIKIT